MKKPRNGNKVATTASLFGVAEMVELGYDPKSPYPPADFQEFDDKTIEVDRCCPRCNYRWSSGDGTSMTDLLNE